MDLHRLHLADLQVTGQPREWPVHGFVVTHDAGAILVDTGVGGPDRLLRDWRVVNRSVAEALADIDMTPSDIDLVVNTHLHFDHCGQNAVFRHAPVYVQRAEVDRARRESPDLWDWFDFAGATFELLDGDTTIVPGIRAISTPGHTVGHQSVLVGEDDLLIGDAAYTTTFYADPEVASEKLVPGQASDVDSWRASLRRLHSAGPERIHFCHDVAVGGRP